MEVSSYWSTHKMRVVRLRKSCLSWDLISYVIQAFLAILSLALMYLVIKLIWNGMHTECDTHTTLFMEKLCSAVADGKITGPACYWLCSAENLQRLTLCPATEHHVMSKHLMLTAGPEDSFSFSTSYYQSVLNGYKIQTVDQSEYSYDRSVDAYRKQLAEVLNSYLNDGSHEEILNTFFKPQTVPVPLNYVESIRSLFENKRFLLSYLFYGTGLSESEPPGFVSESIPPVSNTQYCGGIYQALNLVNYTVPVTTIYNRSHTDTWGGYSIRPLHLQQLLLHLLDLEESTSEHAYEGDFFMCNFNTSQLLLENWCIKHTTNLYKVLDHPCTIKALDVSEMLYSKKEVTQQMSSLSCKSHKDCRFHSCMGECNMQTSTCHISEYTRISSLLQVCHVMRSIEDQILEGHNTSTRGQLYSIIDRCLDMRYFPLDITDSARQLILEYNMVFQDLKMFIINLYQTEDTKIKRLIEKKAAEAEAAKQKKKEGR